MFIIAAQSSVRLAPPGEIRLEYETQKLKEVLQLQKEREAEAKASEELIQKLKQQEEYQKSVMEEKLRFDEQVAKQIAKNWSDSPKCSNSQKPLKKSGPLDKFLKNGIQSGPLNGETNKPFLPAINYATKEFTSVNLSQNRKIPGKLSQNMIAATKEKTAKKNNVQIQRIIAENEANDSSDSIDSECRFFKPIDHKSIPPTTKALAPIKIIPRVANCAMTNIG